MALIANPFYSQNDREFHTEVRRARRRELSADFADLRRFFGEWVGWEICGFLFDFTFSRGGTEDAGNGFGNSLLCVLAALHEANRGRSFYCTPLPVG